MKTYSAYEERSLICPKPRRIGHRSVVADPIRLHRWHNSFSDQEDLLGIREPSPPFFCGSPPSRSDNPLIHDALFGEVDPNGSQDPPPFISSPAPGSVKGCTWTKFGFSPAPVRVEGFDCRGIAALV